MAKVINVKLSDWANDKIIKVRLSEWIAKQKDLPLEIHGKVVNETEKAIQIEHLTTVKTWLPKSQITIESTEKQGE